MRALLLAAMLILSACGSRQPDYPPKSADEIGQLIALGEKAIDVALKVKAGAPAADVQLATSEMLAALHAAHAQSDAILAQVGKVDDLKKGTPDPMGVTRCIHLHRGELQDIENMSPNGMMLWSMNVGGCTASTYVYFRAVSTDDKSAIALALNLIDAIMLVAGTRSGMKNGALMHSLDSNGAIIEKLGPECEKAASKPAGDVSYQCAAYRVAMALRPKLQQLAQ